MLSVFTETYSLPSVDKKEVLRYAGCRSSSADEELISRLDSAIDMVLPHLEPRVCFCELAVSDCDFPSSLDLKKNLRDSESVIFFAATVGISIDRLIARYSITSPATALLLDAIGSERIEALCDAFEDSQREKKSEYGMILRPRFSAGYGDLSVEYQKNIFELLAPSLRIGLSLCDSYLMSPSKSVTALIGVEKIKGN